jgi:hypothetical protein
MEGAINSLFTQLMQIGTQVAIVVCAFFILIGGYQWLTGGHSGFEQATRTWIGAAGGLTVVFMANQIAARLAAAVPHG